MQIIAELKERVINTFKEYGGWWKVERMAEWLDTSNENISKVYDELETEGLMDRKKYPAGR